MIGALDPGQWIIGLALLAATAVFGFYCWRASRRTTNRYASLAWRKTWTNHHRWRGCYVENGPCRLIIAVGPVTVYIPRQGAAPEAASPARLEEWGKKIREATKPGIAP